MNTRLFWRNCLALLHKTVNFTLMCITFVSDICMAGACSLLLFSRAVFYNNMFVVGAMRATVMMP